MAVMAHWGFYEEILAHVFHTSVFAPQIEIHHVYRQTYADGDAHAFRWRSDEWHGGTITFPTSNTKCMAIKSQFKKKKLHRNVRHIKHAGGSIVKAKHTSAKLKTFQLHTERRIREMCI